MTSFDSTKHSLPSILTDIAAGKIQLPDFQRGWVWDDQHVRSLLVSIARSFPVGAVMLLETGGEARFQMRPVEGVKLEQSNEPERLILDGQQRLTTLTQVLASSAPVGTRTSTGKAIKRYYYFHIPTALESPERLEDALIAVEPDRLRKINFGREVVLDLSSLERECTQLYFPCNEIMNSDAWEEGLQQFAPEQFGVYMDFRKQVLTAFRQYQLPIIELKKETSKEAVCLVFEKVNTGGVPLSVFELVTASYAADGYNLRDDWLGSKARQVVSRRQRIAAEPLLQSIEATDFLQAITMLHTREQRLADLGQGKTGKQVTPISAKRASVLDLPLTAFQRWADEVETGLLLAAKFLRKECLFGSKDLPYRTQLVPLAACLSLLKERWLEPRIHEKLSRWYWCGVLGELYGGAVETRIAIDLDDLMKWIDDDSATPRTVSDAAFHPDRLDSLASRQSAAYKAINTLVLRQGAQDFFWKGSVQELDLNDLSLDIHHIFPKAWCEKQAIPRRTYNAIVNKTPISYKANRMIGGIAPSQYLAKIEKHKQVQASSVEMNLILESHCIPPQALRQDDFDAFYTQRKQRLLALIEQAMGKSVVERSDGDILDDSEGDSDEEPDEVDSQIAA